MQHDSHMFFVKGTCFLQNAIILKRILDNGNDLNMTSSALSLESQDHFPMFPAGAIREPQRALKGVAIKGTESHKTSSKRPLSTIRQTLQVPSVPKHCSAGMVSRKHAECLEVKGLVDVLSLLRETIHFNDAYVRASRHMVCLLDMVCWTRFSGSDGDPSHIL